DVLNWEALIGARDISFAGWRQLLPDYLSRLEAGGGAFDLAARGTGRDFTPAGLEFGARGVAAPAAPGPGARFDEIGGSLGIGHAGDRWTVTGKRLRASRAGRQDPESQFDVSWRAGEAGAFDLKARASYLRADNLQPLSGLVPDEDLRE